MDKVKQKDSIKDLMSLAEEIHLESLDSLQTMSRFTSRAMDGFYLGRHYGLEKAREFVLKKLIDLLKSR